MLLLLLCQAQQEHLLGAKSSPIFLCTTWHNGDLICLKFLGIMIVEGIILKKKKIEVWTRDSLTVAALSMLVSDTWRNQEPAPKKESLQYLS